jgi:hypothetical protein
MWLLWQKTMLTPCDNQILPNKQHSRQMIKFQCDCGRIKEIMWKNYNTNHTKSCGQCKSDKFLYKNIYNQKYGLLRLHEDTIDHSINKRTLLNWICDCGNTKQICAGSVINGLTKSCGCLRRLQKQKSKHPILPKQYWLVSLPSLIDIDLPESWSYGSKVTGQFKCKCGNTYQLKINKHKPTSSCGKCNYVIPQTKYGKLSLNPISHKISPYDIIDTVCDCGNHKKIRLKWLLDGSQTTCGQCNTKSIEWWKAQIFGRLSVEEIEQPLKLHSEKKIRCRCNCGGTCYTAAKHLTSGAAISCGKCSEVMEKWWAAKSRLSPNTLAVNNKYDLEMLLEYFHGSMLEPIHGVSTMNTPIDVKCLHCGNIFNTRLTWLYTNKTKSCGCISNSVSRLGYIVKSWFPEAQIEVKVGSYKYDVLIDDILIECHGLRYHSLLRDTRKVDLEKMQNAISNGYRYIMLYEDEIKSNKPKALLENKLGLGSRIKLRTSQLSFSDVPVSEAKQFLIAHHYIGFCGSKIYFGAYHDSALIAIMSFSHPTRQNIEGIELKRFCVHSNYNVYGLGSSMLQKAIKCYGLNEQIVSYSDNRLHDGSLYMKMGFRKYHTSRQDYYWVRKNVRYHKSALRKPKGCHITETELRTSEGYHKIYDLGKTKWIYDQLKTNIT